MRRLLRLIFWLTLLACIAGGSLPLWMAWRAQGKLYPVTGGMLVPHPAQVVLIPGASVLPNKKPSNTLLGRLRAGIELYQKQIVPKVLLSGDNTSRFYDEVHTMRDYCLRHGVKPEDIFLDHAGLRTYDTMLRARKSFGVRSAIVVSQELYLPRALFLAESMGIKAEGYIAESSSFDTKLPAAIREYLARLKSVLDVYVLKPAVPQEPSHPITGDGTETWKK